MTDLATKPQPRFNKLRKRIRGCGCCNRKTAGKARALQRALAAVRYEIVVFVDADTHFQRDTLSALLEPFADESIGAVSGHAKVGNLRTFIARCQALEYTCGFNLDRRAYTRWNCITVVPGAISAIRKSAIDEAGGLSLETLAEDTDLTLMLHKDRQRIVYVPQAIGWTEAPETVRTLARQRFPLGLRNLAVSLETSRHGFQLELSRARLVQSCPASGFSKSFSSRSRRWWICFCSLRCRSVPGARVLPFVITFLAMDVILATLACILEHEPITRAWRILPMRLIYRPMLSYCIWKAILRAIKGAWVSWGKLERTASVPVRA